LRSMDGNRCERKIFVGKHVPVPTKASLGREECPPTIKLTVCAGTAGHVMKAFEPTARRERKASRSIMFIFLLGGCSYNWN